MFLSHIICIEWVKIISSSTSLIEKVRLWQKLFQTPSILYNLKAFYKYFLQVVGFYCHLGSLWIAMVCIPMWKANLNTTVESDKRFPSEDIKQKINQHMPLFSCCKEKYSNFKYPKVPQRKRFTIVPQMKNELIPRV